MKKLHVSWTTENKEVKNFSRYKLGQKRDKFT